MSRVWLGFLAMDCFGFYWLYLFLLSVVTDPFAVVAFLLLFVASVVCIVKYLRYE